MFYLDNTTDWQSIKIEMEAINACYFLELINSERITSGTMTLTSTFDETTATAQWRDDGGGVSVLGHYMLFEIKLPEGLPDGSYELTMAAEWDSGYFAQSYVVQIGCYESNTTEYNKTIEYEQYN